MKDCLFCKIISKEIPSYKIYEDDYVYAFLDIANDVMGHTLVLPKRHYDNLLDCGDRVLSYIMSAVKKISEHYINDCGFSGVNVINNSGQSAEQSVMHLHFHILPRKEGDGIKLWQDFGKQTLTLEEICAELRFEEKKEEKKDYSKFKEDCDVLYTDGACSNNPGPGGYAGVYLPFEGESYQEYSGGENPTTNNRMEIMAVIEGLSLTPEDARIKVYSDSAYVVNAFNQNWLKNWQKNNWRSSTGGEVLNVDLWKKLLQLTSVRQVEFMKVKGHSDNILNNRCDELAREEVKKFGV